MKKSKRLFICALTAVSLASSFVAPIASNAVCQTAVSKFDFLDNEEKYVKLEGKYKEFCDHLNGQMISDEQLAKADIYAVKGGASVFKVIPFDEDEIEVTPAIFNLTEGTTEEQVNALLHKKYNSFFNIERYSNCDYKYMFRRTRLHFKEVCELLKEEGFIDSFVIPESSTVYLIEYDTGNMVYNTGDQEFIPLSYYLNNDEYKALNEYVTENNLGELTLDEYRSNFYYLDIGDFETTEDIFDVAIEIYESTGIYPDYSSPETIPDPEPAGYIDVFNAVNGDANCDNELSIADSTLILQHVGNADKYKLSAQGEFNADVSGEYDGISAADAVAIQRFKVGAIDKLG